MFPWPAYIEDLEKCVEAIGNNAYDTINYFINKMELKKLKFISLDEYYKLFDSNVELKEYLTSLVSKYSYISLPEKHVKSQAAKVKYYVLI